MLPFVRSFFLLYVLIERRRRARSLHRNNMSSFAPQEHEAEILGPYFASPVNRTQFIRAQVQRAEGDRDDWLLLKALEAETKGNGGSSVAIHRLLLPRASSSGRKGDSGGGSDGPCLVSPDLLKRLLAAGLDPGARATADKRFVNSNLLHICAAGGRVEHLRVRGCFSHPAPPPPLLRLVSR